MPKRWKTIPLPSQNAGSVCVRSTMRGERTKIMVLYDVEGIPVAAETLGACSAVINLSKLSLYRQPLVNTPRRLIYDMALDSD